jgi:hypothetical protein
MKVRKAREHKVAATIVAHDGTEIALLKGYNSWSIIYNDGTITIKSLPRIEAKREFKRLAKLKKPIPKN